MSRSQAIGDALVGALFGIALLLTPMAVLSWRTMGNDLNGMSVDWTMVGVGASLWLAAIAALVWRAGFLHNPFKRPPSPTN